MRKTERRRVWESELCTVGEVVGTTEEDGVYEVVIQVIPNEYMYFFVN